ncbi:hypothetical protein Pmani_018272 [Petrolisthes manimaculis]|uniref:Uncharacterized protein n=1 Tax=Petrolisthes manimaculis TaxID=1843537 RepID=A0AAE1U8Y7_9EUCA|nr:hypothetical protein Pmani_018272 [Petrolisthes manimaculis]
MEGRRCCERTRVVEVVVVMVQAALADCYLRRSHTAASSLVPPARPLSDAGFPLTWCIPNPTMALPISSLPPT